MTDEALIAELERQREPARLCFAHYARQGQPGLAFQVPKPDFPEITSSIVAALTEHSVFGHGRNVFFATKQLNLHPSLLPRQLLRVTLDSDAASAVAWLHRLFKVSHAELRVVGMVHGLDVSEPITLVNGVQLLPLRAAPDSPHLRWFTQGYQNTPNPIVDIGLMFVPDVAVLDMGSVAASADLIAGKAVYDAAFAAVQDVARAFTLADRAAPVIGRSWIDFVDPALTAAEFGMVSMSPRFDGSPSQMPAKVDDDALTWANRYLQLDGSLRRSVEVALDRLNLARRRHSPGNQAIDLGICLEALLGDENTQELSYRLRLRAALLLGKTLTERQHIRRAVRDLYDLRSKVVHGGARRAEDAPSDVRCASRGLEICTEAVRAIVQRNSRPDFSVWELIGGPQPDEKLE